MRLGNSVSRVGADAYEFQCWRGESFRAERGNEEETPEAIAAQREMESFHTRYKNTGSYDMDDDFRRIFAAPASKGYGWFVYDMDGLCYGRFLSPIKAAQVFNLKAVSLDGFFS